MKKGFVIRDHDGRYVVHRKNGIFNGYRGIKYFFTSGKTSIRKTKDQYIFSLSSARKIVKYQITQFKKLKIQALNYENHISGY